MNYITILNSDFNALDEIKALKDNFLSIIYTNHSLKGLKTVIFQINVQKSAKKMSRII